MTRYSTYGSVRGFGPLRDTREEAEQDERDDAEDCASLGGGAYSDRWVVEIGDDGYAYEDAEDPSTWVRSDGGTRGVLHPGA